MEIIEIKNIKSYITFIRELYKNDEFFKDTKTDIIEMICNKKSPFCKNSSQKMIGVKSDNEIKCQTILIQHKNLPDTLMLSFFEAKENTEKEVEFLINHAKNYAKDKNIKKLLVSMNGHCNYGLGVLKNNFDNYPEFGQAYNPSYYSNFFETDFIKQKYLTYKNNLHSVGEKILKFREHLKKSDISFLHFDAKCKDFKKTIEIYTELNNKIFEGHCYYYKRENEEDLELFTSMKPLLNNGNLIVAIKNNNPIGFLLWYPDFNELIRKDNRADICTVLKYNCLKQKPKNILLTEIGVYPEYKKTGLILSLFIELYDYLYEKYDKNCNVISGWISNENSDSKNLVKHILDEPYKEFAVYELIV